MSYALSEKTPLNLLKAVNQIMFISLSVLLILMAGFKLGKENGYQTAQSDMSCKAKATAKESQSFMLRIK
jgi:hypothetical protein